MNRAARTLACGLCWLVWAGCNRAPAGGAPAPTLPSSLTDWVAQPLVLPSERDVPCLRLLSAAPDVTEICCGLGLAHCLVGRTRYCTYPPAVQNVPSIGALNDLNVEVLLALHPDLILVSGTSRAQTDRLMRLELRFESIPDVSLTDLFAGTAQIGAAVHRPETARRLCDNIHADLQRVARRFAGHAPASVLLLTGPLPDPPTQVDAAGPGSFYDDLLKLAGYTNAAAPSGRAFAPLSLEFILKADPDVIIELAPDTRSRPGGDADARRVWAKVGPLRAVRAERVYVLADPAYFVLGPRIAQTLEALGERLAGGAP